MPYRLLYPAKLSFSIDGENNIFHDETRFSQYLSTIQPYKMFQKEIQEEIQGTYLNLIKAIYRKSTANLKLNGKKLKVILLKSGTRKNTLHIYSVQYLKLQLIARAIRQKLKIKGIQIGKEKSNFHCLLMILYRSDLKNNTRKLLKLINTFSNVAGYKINSKKISSPPIYR